MLINARHVLATSLLFHIAFAADCSKTSIGIPPLNDPAFPAYQGFGGGLYPDGANTRPDAHQAAGLKAASAIRPRNERGEIDDANGKIVLISIGMSNTAQEFAPFIRLAAEDKTRNPQLVIVSGAQGGWSADRLVENPEPFWSTVSARLAGAGVTANQVQAAWLKEADQSPSLPFPEDARKLQAELRQIVLSLRSLYPNIQIVYLSSRTYAGYALTPLNPEPYAFQGGFAVKWLIEDQIHGDPELSVEAGKAPWLSWGPYLWADGTHPRPDGLTWECTDVREDDGTHPSEEGQRKVAELLLNFFKADSTARPWFSTRPLLYFTIGLHIEPLGATAQGYLRSAGGDYHNPRFFDRHAADILTVTEIVERHGGRMTIQAQSPFTAAALQRNNPILAGLAAQGHEIALHFHEDAHLGANPAALPADAWCGVMKEEIELAALASGGQTIRYWSGGNLYPELLSAAACAGLSVNSDWKNPRTQSTPLELLGVNPWRPAGGTDGSDVALFAQHDSEGPVIFLPEGQYDSPDFASMRRSDLAGGDQAYFDYLKRMLDASLAAAQPDRVNVFHFTIHPGEFRGDPARPFAVIEAFLSSAVDPLVATGQLQWATFSSMAEAFTAWEQANPGVQPRPAPPEPPSPPAPPVPPTPPGPFDQSRAGGSEKDITYCTAAGVPLLMDAYYPVWSGKLWPALVFVHGGGWTGGDKSAPGRGGDLFTTLRDAGFLVFSLNYRLAPRDKFPTMIEDVKCAIRSLRAHASSFNLDPARIGAWGTSAGGHLVNLLGTADASAGFDTGEYSEYSSRVQAVVSLYGPSDLTVDFSGGYLALKEIVFGGFDPALASPITYVSPDDPRFLLVHGEADTLVPISQSEIFRERLEQAGVPVSIVRVANAQHGLAPLPGTQIAPTLPEIHQAILDFFRAVLQ